MSQAVLRVENTAPSIGPSDVFSMGVAQLVLWGVSYYLIGVFGADMAADLKWSREMIYSGFSVALLVMAAVSPLAGRLVDKIGGRWVMATGSVASALGCVTLAYAYSQPVYYAAWIFLGVGMRFTLYDAAFAALARAGGPTAQKAMAQITLFGGLSTACFWPIGHALAEAIGWRGAVLVYAGFCVATIPMHFAIPPERYVGPAVKKAAGGDGKADRRNQRLRAILYAIIFATTNGLWSGMTAHLINILTGLGLENAIAISVAAALGFAQASVRLTNVFIGKRVHPVNLTLLATLILPIAFLIGAAGGAYVSTAVVFVCLFGIGNGTLSITRGTLPLALFDHTVYGSLVGKLLVPSFTFSAVSPVMFAAVSSYYGASGALMLAAFLASLMAGAALVLRLHFREK